MDKSEERLWHFWRIILRFGIYAVIAPLAVYFVPNLITFGQWKRPTPADFVPTVEAVCIPTVRAMKEYQRDNGHLPNTIDELVPKYLSTMPSWGQFIGPNHWYVDYEVMGQTIMYQFSSDSEGWSVMGRYVNGPIPLPRVTIGPSTEPVHPLP